MIEIKNVWVDGFEGALRGIRMPYESHEKSDSDVAKDVYDDCEDCQYRKRCDLSDYYYCHEYAIGPNDMALCKKLIKGGSEHRKFLRMIHVQCEIRAPRYWLTELDTYKVGTVRNSSSTMHLITKRELTRDDFSFDDGIGDESIDYLLESINCRIEACNMKGSDGVYIYSHDERERYFREIKQLLPESFMQRIMWDANYEVLLSIYRQRKGHRLSEWHEFCSWIESLPYMKEFLNA